MTVSNGTHRIVVNGTHLNTRIEGRAGAPWVVLVHSIGTGLGMWNEQVAALASQYRLLRYDISGHGGSDPPPHPCTTAQLAGDLLALLDHFGIVRAHIIGASIGGLIALATGLRAPDRVASIVVSNCRTAVPPDYAAAIDRRNRLVREQGIEATVDSLVTTSLTPTTIATRPVIAEHLRALIRAVSVDGFVACTLAVRDNTLSDALASLRVPTLFIAGADDTAFPPSAMQEMQAQIQGAQFAVIAASAHLSNLDQPAQFNAILQVFLRGVPG